MEDFATELRTRTSGHHKASNALVHLTAPLALSSPTVYRLLVASFYWIFKTLEEELEQRRRLYPKISGIYFRELLRTRAFEKDLAHYYGPDFLKLIGPPTRATAEYIKTLRESVEREPALIVVYCQTMYMAMLGGGQVVKRWVRKAFNARENEGIAIFDFSDSIEDAASFREEYYGALNRISLSREEKDRIIEHKRRIFEGNDAIFEELRHTRAYTSRVVFVLLRLAAAVFVFCVLLNFLPRNFSVLRTFLLAKGVE